MMAGVLWQDLRCSLVYIEYALWGAWQWHQLVTILDMAPNRWTGPPPKITKHNENHSHDMTGSLCAQRRGVRTRVWRMCLPGAGGVEDAHLPQARSTPASVASGDGGSMSNATDPKQKKRMTLVLLQRQPVLCKICGQQVAHEIQSRPLKNTNNIWVRIRQACHPPSTFILPANHTCTRSSSWSCAAQSTNWTVRLCNWLDINQRTWNHIKSAHLK